VVFTPTSTGPKTSALNIKISGVGAQTVALSGSGT
jgi:hypothetical protein